MKKWLASLLLATGGFLCFAPLANSSSNSMIKVQIDGLQQAKGQICYSLFAKSKGFPDSSDNTLQAVRCFYSRAIAKINN